MHLEIVILEILRTVGIDRDDGYEKLLEVELIEFGASLNMGIKLGVQMSFRLLV